MINGKERLSRIVSESSQATVAGRIGVSQQAVHSWVHGLTRPGDVARHKLLATFGIPVESWRTEAEAEEIQRHASDVLDGHTVDKEAV